MNKRYIVLVLLLVWVSVGTDRRTLGWQRETNTKFDVSTSYSLQWTGSGRVRVVQAPAADALLDCSGKKGKSFSIAEAVNLAALELFKIVARTYQQQYQSTPPDRQLKISFPVVKFEITVTGEVNSRTGLMSGTAVGGSNAVGLDGRRIAGARRIEIPFKGLPSRATPPFGTSKTDACFGLEFHSWCHTSDGCKTSVADWYECLGNCGHLVFQFSDRKCYRCVCQRHVCNLFTCGCVTTEEVECPPCVN